MRACVCMCVCMCLEEARTDGVAEVWCRGQVSGQLRKVLLRGGGKEGWRGGVEGQ